MSAFVAWKASIIIIKKAVAANSTSFSNRVSGLDPSIPLSATPGGDDVGSYVDSSSIEEESEDVSQLCKEGSNLIEAASLERRMDWPVLCSGAERDTADLSADGESSDVG